MKYFVLLCNKEWKIEKIIHASPGAAFSEGAYLTDMVAEPGRLTGMDAFEDMPEKKQSVVNLRFRDTGKYIPSIVCAFPDHFMVFLAHVTSEEDFAEFTEIYDRYLLWAEQNLKIPYDDEYYQIQQMNNQLINSQRALVKTNQKLRRVLDEMREADNVISLLERDELTGYYNASAFYRKAHDIMEAGSEKKFDIITLDIARFKLVNEIFGRKAGDGLLRDISVFMLGLQHAEKGLFSRESADMFYILMPSELHFYDILISGVSSFLENYPLPMHLSAKVGVYNVESCGAEGISVEQMCDRARLVLDSDNENTAQNVRFFDWKLKETLAAESWIMSRVPEALENGAFRLYLQPKVDMVSGDVAGAEALIRWIDPEYGMIPPDKFIPLLERDGSVYMLDRFIWEEACRVVSERRALGMREFPISVNVARSDLYRKDIHGVLAGLVEKYGLKPGDIHLEIIERAYVNDHGTMFDVIHELRKNGFVIEMDDFGTGESSLSMLADMPFDIIKLDRHFLVSAIENKRQAEIVRLIINLAHTLDMNIIAEGVETQDQADFLTDMGCRLAQGYFYGRPEDSAEFMKKYR